MNPQGLVKNPQQVDDLEVELDETIEWLLLARELPAPRRHVMISPGLLSDVNSAGSTEKITSDLGSPVGEPEKQNEAEEPEELEVSQSAILARRPTALLLMILGAFPLSNATKGQPSFKLLSPVFTYCLFIYSIYLTIWYFEVYSKLDITGSLDQVMDNLLLLTYHIKYLALPLYMWLPTKRMVELDKHWRQFQVNFRTISGEELKFTLHKYTLPFTIFVTTNSIICCVIWAYMTAFTRPWMVMLYALPVLTSFAFNLHWCIAYVLLGLSATRILDSVKQQCLSQEGAPLAQESSLRSHRILWLELTRVLQCQNDVSVVSFSYHTAHVFIMLTLSLYAVLNGLRSPWTNDQSMRAVIVLTFATELWTVANAAYFTTRRFEKIQWDPFFIIPDIDTPQNILKEMSVFLEVAAVAPKNVNIGGFVIINRTWLINMLGGLLSSLIILLQFKVQAQSKIDSQPFNGTSAETYDALADEL